MPTTATSLNDELSRLFASAPDMLPNPYDVYAELVANHPVYDYGPFVLVSNYGLVRDVLKDKRLSSAAQAEGSSMVEAARAALETDEQRAMFDYVVGIERKFLTQTEGETHDRLRQQVATLFTPRRIATLETDTRDTADSLLAELQREQGETIDLAWFAERLPALVIASLLGAPHEDADELVRWGQKILKNLFGGQGVQALEAAYEGHRWYDQYVQSILDGFRVSGTATEAADALLRAASEGVIDDEQLSAAFREQLLGGFETTRVALLGAVFMLMRHPDQWREVVAEPALAANAFEENLRYFGSSQWTARVVLEDVNIGDVEIPAGKTILVMLAAANRDPEEFADPATFDIGRKNARHHLGFGIGKHYCIGQALARLEGRLTIEILATRFPKMELAIEAKDVPFGGQMFLRRVESLPVRVG